MHELFPDEIKAQLIANSKAQSEKLMDESNLDGETIDFAPVVKIFDAWGAATWLFTELDEDGRLFGLGDLGMQCPELGYTSIAELEELATRPLKVGLERDIHFVAKGGLSEYTAKARDAGQIVA